MPFRSLASLANNPLRLRLLHLAAEHSLSLACVNAVMTQAARLLPVGRLQIEIISSEQMQQLAADAVLPDADICLLLTEGDSTPPAPPLLARLLQTCADARYWGASGAAVLWAARRPDGTAPQRHLGGVRAALAWALHAELDSDLDSEHEPMQAMLQLYEFDQGFLSCCGAAPSLDFALALAGGIYGPSLQGRVQEVLGVDTVRAGSERQRQGAQPRALPFKLAEVLALMQANIEEPLSSDDLANLVGISRRQLERLFKQYLGNLPSRYYLELRLAHARKLLIESHYSIVQVGLMCGFSSGSHFSTAFSALFGITPREERQRRLKD